MNDYLPAAWNIVEPLAMMLVYTVGPILVTWLAAKIVGLLNIKNDEARLKVEAQLRDALHQSAVNGLRYAATKLGANAATDALVEAAKEYVETKNPDNLAKARVDPGALRDIIMSKVPEVLSGLAR